jgi:hypothetical protein
MTTLTKRTKRELDMANGTATVFIWNNNHGLPIVGRHSVVGHASMVIGKTTSGETMREDSYVSWGPAFSGATSQGLTLGESWSSYGDFDKYAPDHVIQVDNVNEQVMREAWSSLRSKPNAHYRYYVKNCSVVVARILKAGRSNTGISGLSTFAYFTPLQVKRLALSMGGREISWQLFALHSGFSANYVNLWKRSSSHGNPETPARFV